MKEKLLYYIYIYIVNNGKMSKIINIVIIIAFISIALITGINHEPWADEAQAWLIVRDSTINEIIFDITKFEGTPMFWHLLLKFLIMLGLEYKYFYLVPLVFSTLGIAIIVFKLKIPNIIKILLPFSYFIIYEYTIKARSYCLILPILAMIAVIYENRKKKVYTYNFLLGILSTICLYSTILSITLYILEIIEILKEYLSTEKINNIKKEIISIIGLSILYLFIIITMIPDNNVYTTVLITNLEKYGIGWMILLCIIKVLEGLILNYQNFYISILPSLIFAIVMSILILKGNKNKKKFLFLTIPSIVFMCIIRVSNHHIGLFTYIIFFALYITKDNIQKNNIKPLHGLLTIMFIIQMVWGIKAINLEIKEQCSGSKELAQYLQTLNYEELDIYAFGYYATSILPYFEENIFDNDRGGSTYYTWSIDNKDWYACICKEFIYEENFENRPDIIIFHSNYAHEGYTKLIDKVRELNEYSEKQFVGYAFYKGNIYTYKNPDNEGFYIFERKK